MAQTKRFDVSTDFKADLEALKTERESYRTAKLQERQEVQKTRTLALAEKMVDVRIRVLEAQKNRILNGRCSNIKAIDVATPVNSAITSMSADLTTYLGTIQGLTDLAAIRAELKEAIDTTKVFSALNPAISGLCASGRILDRIADKIEPAVARAEADGSDVAAIEVLIASAKTKINEAITIFTSVLNDPGASTAKDSIKAGRDQLKAAHQDLVAAVQELRKLGGNTTTETPE
ncbi:MAG: hypothetical protein WEC83_00020 [Patescibacteria group bacterium]